MSLHARLALPLIRAFAPETAHGLTLAALRLGLAGADRRPDPPALGVRALGLDFPNPIGLAAGFDKNGEVPDAMLALGFGFVEVGTVTPRPQAGNPKPRLFRLDADRAVINRMGFNNAGLAALRDRLARRQGRPGILGGNIGANKDAADRIADYVTGFEALAGLCAYLTVNVSSPNTPGLRGLQDRAALEDLLGRLTEARARSGRPAPLLLKIAPDLEDEAMDEIVAVALAAGIEGLIISNTTIARPPHLRDPRRREAGGLSGAPLMAPSTAILARAARAARGRLVLVGAGGVASGADAYAKIRAGASLVQLYSALVYDGPALVGRIKRDLAACLARDGFSDVASARDAGLAALNA